MFQRKNKGLIMKKLIKKLLREEFNNDFETTFTNKWRDITNNVEPFEITSKYDSHDIIDFVTHFDTEYFKDNIYKLIDGVSENSKLTHFKKLYIKFLIKDKCGYVSKEERNEFLNMYKTQNDYPSDRKNLYR